MYYSRNPEDDLIVYVEKFDKKSGVVLVDCIDSGEFDAFAAIVRPNYNWETGPTMIEIRDYHGKPVREGVNYRIEVKALRSLLERIQFVEDSFIVGFLIELTAEDVDIFKSTKTLSNDDRFRLFFPGPGNSFPANALTVSGDQVIVRDIGQGSWNEVSTKGEVSLVFDIGTLWTTKKTDVQRLTGNRNAMYQHSKPALILSHWDVDHYHFLVHLEDQTIKSFSAFITRSHAPTITARKVAGRFRILNPGSLIEIDPLQPPPPLKSSCALASSYLTASGEYVIFNSFRNSSRNKCGLGLAIRKKSTSVIFSGDYDYSQVSDYILPLLNFKCDHYLIVPHHGGKAGKFAYRHSPLNILKEAVISVGKNPYNPQHPYTHNINNLRTIGFKVIQTNLKQSDHVIQL